MIFGYGRQDGKAVITKINFNCLKTMKVMMTSGRKWHTPMWKDFVGFYFITIRVVLLGSGFIHIITLLSPQISVTLHHFQTLLKKEHNRLSL